MSDEVSDLALLKKQFLKKRTKNVRDALIASGDPGDIFLSGR